MSAFTPIARSGTPIISNKKHLQAEPLQRTGTLHRPLNLTSTMSSISSKSASSTQDDSHVQSPTKFRFSSPVHVPSGSSFHSPQRSFQNSLQSSTTRRRTNNSKGGSSPRSVTDFKGRSPPKQHARRRQSKKVASKGSGSKSSSPLEWIFSDFIGKCRMDR